MKKSNVISIRLDDKEVEKLKLYSKLFNTDKPSIIVKGLLTMNPYFEILKGIIKDFDDKEYNLILLQMEFKNDKDIYKIINNKIENIRQTRTDILRKIDEQLTAIGIIHNLFNNNIDNKELNLSKENDKSIDYIDPAISEIFNDEHENIDGEELLKQIEEEERIERVNMEMRARLYLNNL